MVCYSLCVDQLCRVVDSRNVAWWRYIVARGVTERRRYLELHRFDDHDYLWRDALAGMSHFKCMLSYRQHKEIFYIMFSMSIYITEMYSYQVHNYLWVNVHIHTCVCVRVFLCGRACMRACVRACLHVCVRECTLYSGTRSSIKGINISK